MAGDEFFPDTGAPAPARAPKPSGSRGRVPPHNVDAEESVLGALLLSRDAMNAVSELNVMPGDFYRPAHRHIFDAIRSLYSSGAPVDVVTVADDMVDARWALQAAQWDARAFAAVGLHPTHAGDLDDVREERRREALAPHPPVDRLGQFQTRHYLVVLHVLLSSLLLAGVSLPGPVSTR